MRTDMYKARDMLVDTFSRLSLKQKMEYIWNTPRVANPFQICKWRLGNIVLAEKYSNYF